MKHEIREYKLGTNVGNECNEKIGTIIEVKRIPEIDDIEYLVKFETGCTWYSRCLIFLV